MLSPARTPEPPDIGRKCSPRYGGAAPGHRLFLWSGWGPAGWCPRQTLTFNINYLPEGHRAVVNVWCRFGTSEICGGEQGRREGEQFRSRWALSGVVKFLRRGCRGNQIREQTLRSPRPGLRDGNISDHKTQNQCATKPSTNFRLMWH